MAAYGALVSLMNTINDIHHHPHPPISLDQHQIESFTEAANFFKDFLGTYNPHSSYTNVEDPLEKRIAAASYAAEDAIESCIVDHILSRHNCEAARNALYEDLQRVIGDMGSIKKEAIEIKQRKGVQHHQTLQLRSRSTAKSSASTSRSSSMVGIEKVTNELLDNLIGVNELRRQVIPITGMGGIGKTTLATNVYQLQIVVEHFDIRAWATISQDFRMKETILKLYQEEDSSEMNEYELGEKLYKKLSGRRYLIVLDDVWDVKVWDALQLYFPDYNNKSRIVLTTRLSKLSHDVSGNGSPSLGIEMRFLDEDTSWDLFCKVVFEREDCPLELETIGREIVESCKGLPLSINVIGGLLAMSAQTQEYWEYVAENLTSIVNSEDNERCLKILYTSYNSLPVYLKPCFIYMGVLKEDSEICISHLIRLWVAEGFVEAASGKNLEEVAEEWLTELVGRNLILVHQHDSLGKLKLCRIHDLLRDLCLREARKHKFIHIVDARSFDMHIPPDLSGVRHICNYEKWRYLSGGLGSPSVARSLMWENEIFHVPIFGLKLLRTCSTDLKGVHDLDFVCRRVNLRFLCARGPAHLDSFLSSISIFWNLQTLIADDARSCSVTPSEIWNMTRLRHIEFKPTIELPDPPPTDDDFVVKENLQTLSVVRNMKFCDEVVKRIPNIKKLKVVYRDVEEGLSHGYCLNNLSHLRALSSLSLRNSIGRGFSLEMQNMTFPQSLKKLTLSNTRLRWKDMTQKLGSLPLLEVLRLRDDACVGAEWHTAEGQFCSLRILEIYDSCLDNLEYWETDSSHFPRLEHLVLCDVWNMKEVPSSIGEIPTLQSITLVECDHLAYGSARRIREEQVEQGNEGLQVNLDDDSEEDDSEEEEEEDEDEDEDEDEEEEEEEEEEEVVVVGDNGEDETTRIRRIFNEK